jgi:hypothetical protein
MSGSTFANEFSASVRLFLTNATREPERQRKIQLGGSVQLLKDYTEDAIGLESTSEAMSGYWNRNQRRLILSLFVIALIECVAAGFCRILPSAFIWHPDLAVARENWDALLPLVDDEVGGFRASEAKPNSEFPSGPSCGAAFGDSYVGGAEVADGQGWVEQLSHLLGCRVTNYAVNNYGTDQAYLHFRRIRDVSPSVILGVNPNTVEDNVNQYDALLGSELEPTALKGRFLFDRSHQLEWSPLPRLDADTFVALNRNPAKMLPNSYFLPDTPDGPVSLGFPYTGSLIRIALRPRLHDVLLRRADWGALYLPDHPSGALNLMIAICEAFVESAKARGQRPFIIMLPLAASFREKADRGQFEYAPLVLALRDQGIEVFDPGGAMLSSLGGRSPCDFFNRPQGNALKAWLMSPMPCSGHYSIAGNTLIAQLVATELRRRTFFPINLKSDSGGSNYDQVIHGPLNRP